MWRKNIGPLDRAIRLAGGAVLFGAGLFLLGGLEASAVGIVVAALGLWFMVTGAIGRCPLYVLLGISTLREWQGSVEQSPGSRRPHESSVYPPSPNRPDGLVQRPQRDPVGTRR
jgi:Protein of unknown function (DUF2892)